jgi:hypothetical protein
MTTNRARQRAEALFKKERETESTAIAQSRATLLALREKTARLKRLRLLREEAEKKVRDAAPKCGAAQAP